jgi:hypothetical protein
MVGFGDSIAGRWISFSSFPYFHRGGAPEPETSIFVAKSIAYTLFLYIQDRNFVAQ